MSIKLLQGEGKILPISGKICQTCKLLHDNKYRGKPGEKVVIILKKPTTTTQQPTTSNNIKVENTVPRSRRSMTIKPIKETEEEERVSSSMSVLSQDSDNDPTWSPKARRNSESSNSDSNEKKSELLTHFVSTNDEDDEGIDPMADNIVGVDPTGELINARPTALKPSELLKDDSKYYCKLCKISFYKLSSYLYHKNVSQELHNRTKLRLRQEREHTLDEDEYYECSDCCIAFSDRVNQQKHFAEVHFTVDHPFHCKSCNIILKNESAFKSHNSKLHLERREKSYYCRECDETFACKLKHQRHILIHRPWNNDPKALQCKICGKVFTRNQGAAHHRHLETHDSDPNEPCTCIDCFVDNISPPSSPELPLKKSKLNDDSINEDVDDRDDDDEDDDDDQVIKPFECGLCSMKFASPNSLEKHVTSCDGKNIQEEVEDEEEEEDECKNLIPLVELKEPSTSENGFEINETKIMDIKSSDLFQKMKMSFKDGLTDNEEEGSTEQSFEIFQTRGLYPLKPNSIKRSPRVISASSRATRKRMEALLKRAKEFMKKKEKKGLSPPSSPISEPPDSEDDAFDETDSELEENEEEEGLLIPLENGWVCEKKWDQDDKAYCTHFWSPDGLRHSSLAVIKFYGEKKNLNLDMNVFHRAVENNPPPPEEEEKNEDLGEEATEVMTNPVVPDDLIDDEI